MDKLGKFLLAVINKPNEVQIRFRPIEFYVDQHGQWISINFRLLPLNSWVCIQMLPSGVDIPDDEIPF